MDELIAQLVALTAEEQAIYRQAWIEPAGAQRLVAIRAERTYLLGVKRALAAGADPLLCVPIGGYKVDQPNGWSSMHKKRGAEALRGARLPVASAAELRRELAAYQEERGHAAD